MISKFRVAGVLVSLAGLVVATSAWAQGSSPAAGGKRVSAEVPGVVEALRAEGVSLTPLGKRGGLDGWFVRPRKGEPYSLYVTADGHAVAGLLYGPRGELVTGGQLAASVNASPGRRFAEASTARQRRVETERGGGSAGSVLEGAKAVAAGLFVRSADAFGFTLGQRGPVVLVLADPGCEWSRSTVAELGGLAAAGRFRLRVVPVGVLGAGSTMAAIRIVSSPDPALAWFGRDVAAAHRAGGQWIEENNGIFELWGVDSVPVIAWPSPKSAGFQYGVGAISETERWMEEVFGP